MSVIIGSDVATAFTNNSISNGTAGTRWVGQLYTAVANGTIDTLSVLDNNSDGSFKITLHDASGNLLRTTAPITPASNTVKSGSITPLDVTTGQQFYIGRYIASGYGRYKGHTTQKAMAQTVGTYASPAATIAPTTDSGSDRPLMWAQGVIAAYEINDINSGAGVKVGSSGNTVNTTGLGDLTSLTIGGKAVVSLLAPAGDGSFSMPEMADGQVYPPYGNNNALAGDGSHTSTAYNTALLPKDSQAYKVLTSVNNSNPLFIPWHIEQAGFTSKIGDTVTFDKPETLGVSVNKVEEDGAIFSDYDQAQTMQYRFVDTGEIVFLNFVASGIAPVMPSDRDLIVIPGMTDLGTFEALSGDLPMLYSLDGADASSFTLDENTASLTLNSPAVFGDSFEIVITAENAFGEDSQALFISVEENLEMATKRVLFFMAGANPTPDELVAIQKFDAPFSVIVLNSTVSALYGDKLMPCDYVAGTVPTAYNAIPTINPSQIPQLPLLPTEAIVTNSQKITGVTGSGTVANIAVNPTTKAVTVTLSSS